MKSLSSPEKSRRKERKEENLEFRDKKFLAALSTPSILIEILAYAESIFCSEGILFWIDIQVWKGMIPNEEIPSIPPPSLPPSPSSIVLRSEALSALTEVLTAGEPQVQQQPQFLFVPDTKEAGREKSVSKSISKRSVPTGPVRDLQELRNFACDIFCTYFARNEYGSAPLLLNIPDPMYQEITEKLIIKIESDPDGGDNKLTCNFPFSISLKSIFEPVEKEILTLLYDNIYLPFNTKNNVGILLDSEKKLHGLEDGNLMPFNKMDVGLSPELELGKHLTEVVIPTGEGGVTTGGLLRPVTLPLPTDDTPNLGIQTLDPTFFTADAEESFVV